MSVVLGAKVPEWRDGDRSGVTATGAARSPAA